MLKRVHFVQKKKFLSTCAPYSQLFLGTICLIFLCFPKTYEVLNRKNGEIS